MAKWSMASNLFQIMSEMGGGSSSVTAEVDYLLPFRELHFTDLEEVAIICKWNNKNY